ncbi:hypothetical protein PUMCH_004751 [Australozyma saopauloensis]|uniref:Zn(2)-C6 fungal-type domain-containing protein n=1 Tax=Australozyma saopauloensis TaxID=291208 RepID=A0AAX4HFL5_9ASCO|nr:hypothetical protein PUMCH_004751 [[Candida] saopauloensis]
MEEPPRKKRQLLVCTLCRERKVRCDRNLPCASCKKHHTESLCMYETTPENISQNRSPTGSANGEARLAGDQGNQNIAMPGTRKRIKAVGLLAIDPDPSETVYLASTTVTDVLFHLKGLRNIMGVNPVARPDDHINFFRNYSSVSFCPNTQEEINHGPFLWHSIVRVDPGLLQVWSFIMNVRPAGANLKGITSYQNIWQGESAQLRVIDKIKQHLLVKFKSTDAVLNSQDVPLGLTFMDPNSQKRDLGLSERLKGILPYRRLIWSHIDQFFKYVYPFFPYLDEQLFRASVTRIIGACVYDDSNVTRVVAQGVSDYALIGILCIVLRLSYLSLISNDQEYNVQMTTSAADDPSLDPITREMLMKPLGLEFIDLARRCLHHFEVQTRSNLTILQLLVFTRIYMELSPEDLEGPARDVYQLNNGVLLQMAYVIGLNREPDLMTDTLNNKRLNHVRRKLWIFIQFKGILNSLKFGSPYIASSICTDARFPFFRESNRNCCDPELDHYVAISFKPLEELIVLMSNVSSLILRIKDGTSMAELVEHVNKLEIFVFNELGTLRTCLESFSETGEKSIVPVLMTPYHLPIYVFLISLHFRLFAYYESKGCILLAMFYCKKILLLIAEEMLPFTYDILDKPHPYFKYAAQLVLNPQIEYFMHRSVGFLAAWAARVGNQIMFSPENGPIRAPYSRQRVLIRSFGRLYKLCLLSILKLNKRYCYAWRIGCTFSYILKCVVTEGFYERLKETGILPLKTAEYTEDQMMTLSELMDKPLKDSHARKGAQYFDIVKEVIKFGNGDTAKLYDPSSSRTLFHDLVVAADGITLEGASDIKSEELFTDPSWFPALEAPGADLASVMGSFFDGPDAYFDSFKDITSGPLYQNYGF